jgi:hypothetical protein
VLDGTGGLSLAGIKDGVEHLLGQVGVASCPCQDSENLLLAQRGTCIKALRAPERPTQMLGTLVNGLCPARRWTRATQRAWWEWPLVGPVRRSRAAPGGVLPRALAK